MMIKNDLDILDVIYEWMDAHGGKNMADALEIIVDKLRYENEDLKRENEDLQTIIDEK